MPAVVQATIVTPDEGLVVPRFVNELAPRWRERFDGAPVVLPAGLPLPEIPRVVLASADGAWRFEVAATRASVFCTATTDHLPITAQAFFAEAARLLVDYTQTFQLRVARLGGVLTRAALRSAPGTYLARHFCSERWAMQPLNRPEAFELHAHKRYELQGWGLVNSWVRNKTAQVVRPPLGPQPAVVVEQDLNTMSEDVATSRYSDAQVQSFFSLLSTEFDNILCLYYPEESA